MWKTKTKERQEHRRMKAVRTVGTVERERERERELYFTETTKKTSNKIGEKEGKKIPLLNIYKDRL